MSFLGSPQQKVKALGRVVLHEVGALCEHLRAMNAENWNAPTTLNTAELTMCSTTDQGPAKKRALSGVTSEPVVTCTILNKPTATGTALSASSPASSHLSAACVLRDI